MEYPEWLALNQEVLVVPECKCWVGRQEPFLAVVVYLNGDLADIVAPGIDAEPVPVEWLRRPPPKKNCAVCWHEVEAPKEKDKRQMSLLGDE